MYSFNPKKLGTSHKELCRFNSFNALITTCQPGWFGNETVTFKPDTLPESFFATFVDIGRIQSTKQNIPQPTRLNKMP